MALNPLIPLSGTRPDPINIGQSFSNSLANVEQIRRTRQAGEQEGAQNRLLEANAGIAEQAKERDEQLNHVRTMAIPASIVIPFLESGDVDGARNALVDHISKIEGRGGDASHSKRGLVSLDQDGGAKDLLSNSKRLVETAQQLGVFPGSASIRPTSSSKDFAQFQKLIRQAEATGDPADIKAAEQFGRQSGFTRETAQELADIGVQKAGDIARSRAGVQLDTEPAIEAAVTEAVGEAKAKTPLGAQELESKRQQQRITRQKSVLANAELKLKRTEAVAQADDTIALIDKLIAHPGRKAATGTTAIFPTTPGSRAADFEADFNRLKGSAFLEAVQKLKGSGQISNTEGEAATASVLGIEIGQSEEGFVESLKSLKSRINEAKKRRSGTFADAESQDLTQSSDDDLLSF